jgi:hypothetical protein
MCTATANREPSITDDARAVARRKRAYTKAGNSQANLELEAIQADGEALAARLGKFIEQHNEKCGCPLCSYLDWWVHRDLMVFHANVEQGLANINGNHPPSDGAREKLLQEIIAERGLEPAAA